MDIAVGKAAIYEAAEKLSNWGRWGEDDQIGTLNHVGPDEIVAASKLVRKGKVFAMGIPLNQQGPQSGLFGGRSNPIHTCSRPAPTPSPGGSTRPTSCASPTTPSTCRCRPRRTGTARPHLPRRQDVQRPPRAPRRRRRRARARHRARSARMVGRGVLLDVARRKGVDWFEDGYGISNDELDATAKAQGVEVRKGDFVIVRTGQMERCLKEKKWGADAGGPAPGVKFENCYWCQEKESPASAPTPGASRCGRRDHGRAAALALGRDPGDGPAPWARCSISPSSPRTARRTASTSSSSPAPPLVITGGTGSPINPLAIK